MLRLYRWTRWLSCTGWVLLFIPMDTFAIGGAGDQGVLLAGEGIDWQRSGTQLQPVPFVTAATFPPPNKAQFVGVGAAMIEVQSCSSLSTRHARCDVTVVNIGGASSRFCGVWLKNNEPRSINLYALNAKHKDGRFDFQPAGEQPRQIVFACGVENTLKVDQREWAALGAIGKCMLWPFPNPGKLSAPDCLPPTPEGYLPTDTDRFNTCIRAVRADYCGQGVSYTKDKTVIDLYEVANAATHVPRPAFLLEANWDQNGAICILHARYVSLSPECRKKFPIPVSLFGGVAKKPEKPEKDAQKKDIRGVDQFEKEKKSDKWDEDGEFAGYKGSEYHCQSFAYRADKCDPTGTCAKLKGFRDLLTKGYLMDDSLLQP